MKYKAVVLALRSEAFKRNFQQRAQVFEFLTALTRESKVKVSKRFLFLSEPAFIQWFIFHLGFTAAQGKAKWDASFRNPKVSREKNEELQVCRTIISKRRRPFTRLPGLQG